MKTLLSKWHKTLITKAKVLMDNDYYTHDQAMIKVWNNHYNSIYQDLNEEVKELRLLFWSKEFSELEVYNDTIIARY